MSLTWPDHLLTLAEWAELPLDSTHRTELAEGVLVVVPRPGARHQYALGRLFATLRPQLPPDLTAVVGCEVVIDPGRDGGPATVRVPDLVVVPEALVRARAARLDAADVRLAVEILAQGTRGTDLVTKRAEYAEVGIGGYWTLEVDTRPPTGTARGLAGGRYEVLQERAERLVVVDPLPLVVDVGDLLL